MRFSVARLGAFVIAGGLLAGLAYYTATRQAPEDNTASVSSLPLVEIETPWVTAMASKVRLESTQSALGEGYVFLGLEMQLDEGWKTYWRHAGDSGFAPRFDWSGSTNLKSIDMQWPAPLAFDEFGERYYGYKGTAIWPLKVTVEDADKPLSLSLKMDYGVCEEVCIPVSVVTQLVVPAGPSLRTSGAQRIEDATLRVPQTVRSARLDIAVHLRKVEGHRAYLVIEIESTDQNPAFVPEVVILTGLEGVYFGASQPFGEKGFRVALETNTPDMLRGRQVDVTVLGAAGGQAAVAGFFYIQ